MGAGMKTGGPCQRLVGWLGERLGLGETLERLGAYEHPRHPGGWWQYSGGLCLFLLLIQVCTGVLLAFHYHPGSAAAHPSLQHLGAQVPGGAFLRSLHAHTAHAFIAMLLLHMGAAFVFRAYRSPRELTWWSGLLLLALGLGFAFTGTLLPWDQLALSATRVGLELAERLPLAGPALASVMRGGAGVGEATLQRFFALHVLLLPLLALPILLFHLRQAFRQGPALPSWAKVRGKLPFWPDVVIREGFLWLGALDLLILAALAWPVDLGPMADPLASTPEGLHPEWYFMPVYQFLKLLPGRLGNLDGLRLGLILLAGVGAAWALLPLWDRGRARRWAELAGPLLLATLLVLGVWGYLALPAAA